MIGDKDPKLIKCIADYAHNCVYSAVTQGLLPKINTQKCVDCGRRASSYDHRDYEKPLDVDPVCGRCNRYRGQAFNSSDVFVFDFHITNYHATLVTLTKTQEG